MVNTSVAQASVLNSIVYEGKILSDWIDHFRLPFNEMESGEVLTTFLSKSAEAYYLYSKIKPYTETLESRLKRLYDAERVSMIEAITADKTKRTPSLDLLDSMIKIKLIKKYEELEVAKFILSTFEIILREYEALSYIVTKKFS